MSVVTSFILGSRLPVGISDDHSSRLVPPGPPRPRSARAGRGVPRSSIACCRCSCSTPAARGRFRSADRTAWMLGALRRSTRSCATAAGAWRCAGPPEEVLPASCGRSAPPPSTAARRRTGFARARDDRVGARRSATCSSPPPGVYIADLGTSPRRTAGRTRCSARSCGPGRGRSAAPMCGRPSAIELPSGAKAGRMPSLTTLGFDGRARPPRPPAGLGRGGGQDGGRRWVRSEVRALREGRNTLGRRHSRLSVHLRFGMLSPLWLEERGAPPAAAGPTCTAPSSPGATSTARCCCTTRRRPGRSSRSATGTLEWDDDPDGARGLEGGRDGLSRSSTPRCASCASWAGCTTARG